MPIDEVEAESGEERPHKRQRLRLIESYGAFSDDRLREVTEKIRDVTSSQSHQSVPTATHVDESLGDPSGDPSNEARTALLDIPIRRPLDIPNDSPERSPNETSIQQANESSIGASYRVPHRDGSDHPVLLTENQAILYFCLQRIGGETTSLSRIARETASIR
jgi:hypothetical protein